MVIHESSISSGMLADVKNLYLSNPDIYGKETWVDEIPVDLKAAAENSETTRYALLVRNKKCFDGRKNLQIDSFVVQSPRLREALLGVFEGYPGITTSLERLEFTSPFQCFIHRWDTLTELVEKETDSTMKKHLTVLHALLKTELQHDLKARDDYVRNGVITFDTLWMLFDPRSIVYRKKDEISDAAQLVSASYSEDDEGKYLSLSCQTIMWDGSKFGTSKCQWSVRAFTGTMEITRLAAFPLRYHKDAKNLTRMFRQRGETYESLRGFHFKYYRGVAIREMQSGPVKVYVDSRIIIDTYGWNCYMSNTRVVISALRNLPKPLILEDSDDSDEPADDDVDADLPDSSLLTNSNTKRPVRPLTKHQHLICTSALKGYSLKNKRWLTFSISNLQPIEWSSTAFSSLVLPPSHKDLILALATSQMKEPDRPSNDFDDIIQGKGKGMVILLSGPPGVGKTLTAESVAETMHAPLYTMSSSDLGYSSRDVERHLSRILDLTAKWKAVLLLDEADVFLEARSAHDLERNKLVSTFLRVLEYFEGTLFLTTNRIQNIDAAFQSRIHISMEYSELSTDSRRTIWENFLTATTPTGGFSGAAVPPSPDPPDGSAPSPTNAGPSGVSSEEMDTLANYRMNGREIKNVLKTAKLLASSKAEELRFEHIKKVLSIEQRHVGTQL